MKRIQESEDYQEEEIIRLSAFSGAFSFSRYVIS